MVCAIRHTTLSALILILLVGPKLASQPTPSPALPSVLARQAERAKKGIKDHQPFLAELEPLAKSGDATAQFLLATQLMGSDESKAVSWLRQSANGGCAGAAGVLGAFLLQSSSPDSANWIHQAAKGGDAMSIQFLATFHEKGEFGYTKSSEHCLAYLELAQRQSYSKALSDSLTGRIRTLRSALTPEQLKISEEILSKLFIEFPKVGFYIGGQSLP